MPYIIKIFELHFNILKESNAEQNDLLLWLGVIIILKKMCVALKVLKESLKEFKHIMFYGISFSEVYYIFKREWHA